MRPYLRLMAGTAAVGTAALAYATLIERNLFALRRVEAPVLAPDARPLRVLHLSDLHLTPGQHHKRRWVTALASEEPDLVVVTGDNLGAVDSVGPVLRAFEPLLDRPGAFVFGSNDYRGPAFKNPFGYFNPNRRYVQGPALPAEELRDALTGAGWADLSNARATMDVNGQTVSFVGVDDPHIGRDVYPDADGPEPGDSAPTGDANGRAEAIANANGRVQSIADTNGRVETAVDPAVRIGVLHAPEPRVIDAMADDDCDLILAGHTHGGQVRVPVYGALVTNCGLDRRLARGLHRWPDSMAYLHVSAGLGTHSTAPIRFSCRPEATLLTLTPRR
jgi:uncharacterized protein